MTDPRLAGLGWSAHFQSQLDADDGPPWRVGAVHRDRIGLVGAGGAVSAGLAPALSPGGIAVGDWVVTDPAGRVSRVLDRQSLLSRRAAGEDARTQLIAANVGTLAIVSSCNADFNLARLERYLVLATQAGCLPLVVLTKADLCDDPGDYRKRAERLSPLVTALTVDARSPDDLGRLAPWCGPGETLAMVGSSGVGKTTILNGLTGRHDATQAIREDDAKGRHTTTARELVQTRAGGWVIDTPGMRALRLADAQDGLDTVFGDIEALAATCRFGDCGHTSEPGCAVQAAVAGGDLDPARLDRWRKLLREDARNSESIAEARARDRALGKVYRTAQASRRRKRGD